MSEETKKLDDEATKKELNLWMVVAYLKIASALFSDENKPKLGHRFELLAKAVAETFEI